MKISFLTPDISNSTKICNSNPKVAIPLIKKTLKIGIEKHLLVNAYILLANSYKVNNDTKNQIVFLNLAIENSFNPEDKIRSLCQRSNAFCDLSLLIDSYSDIIQVEKIIATNKVSNVDIIISIKIFKFYLLRLCRKNLIEERYFAEVDKFESTCTNQNLLAHLFKAKGIFQVDKKNFSIALHFFQKSNNLFESLKYYDDLDQISEKIAICKYKCNDSTYIENQKTFQSSIAKKNGLMTKLRHLIALNNSEINPFRYFNISIPDYLEILNYCISIKEWKDAANLSSFLAKEYQIRNNKDLALLHFNNQVDFHLMALKESDENKVFEMYIHHELQQQIKTSSQLVTAIESPSIIKEYVSTNLTPFVAQELNRGNYQVMSSLIIDQFKTQVSICSNSGIKFIETNQIQALESDGNYTILYDQNQKRHISSKPLAYYEKQLDPKMFLRTHRSYIVNKNFIKTFYPGRVGKIELTNGQIVEVSARKMAEVRKKILN